jgi:hypothetical protein
VTDALLRSISRMGQERLRVVDLDAVGPVLQAWVRERDLRGWHWDWLQTLDQDEADAWRCALARDGDSVVGCPGCGLTLDPHGPDCPVSLLHDREASHTEAVGRLAADLPTNADDERLIDDMMAAARDKEASDHE